MLQTTSNSIIAKTLFFCATMEPAIIIKSMLFCLNQASVEVCDLDNRTMFSVLRFTSEQLNSQW